MSLYPIKPLASTVCDQCKKRKKSCTKTLPSCSRCTRFLVKCTYTTLPKNPLGIEKGVHPPRLVELIPSLAPSPRNEGPGHWSSHQVIGVDEQVSVQALQLLNSITRKRGPIDEFIETYFRTFHRSLPIINKDAFYAQLQHGSPSSHFSSLLLSLILISHLSSKIGRAEGMQREELYPTLKSIYGLLVSTGKVSIELVQVGVIIAAWEHCQALHQDAWLSIGACVRIGNVLGLHHVIKKAEKRESEGEERGEREEEMKSLWWGIVVLERIISLEYEPNKLPFASQPPFLDDLLPLIPGDNIMSRPVSTDLITPDMTDESEIELFNRPFTKLGNFGSTVQATYLCDLVINHITTSHPSVEFGQEEAGKLEAALQSFACTLIPPPGRADGQYCGAYGLRTMSLFALHEHSLAFAIQTGKEDSITRATIALQSLARITIHMTKAGAVGKPIDFDSLAFWAHGQIAKAALVHIRFRVGVGNREWEEDLGLLKRYLRCFEGRFELHEKYLREIEEAEKASLGTKHTDLANARRHSGWSRSWLDHAIQQDDY